MFCNFLLYLINFNLSFSSKCSKSILEKSKDLYRIAYAITGNEEDSKDAISSTILKVCEKIYTLKKPEFFKTWMTRILINECKNILRKRNLFLCKSNIFIDNREFNL